MPLTEERIKHCYPGETLSSICDRIPQNIDPRPVSEPRLPVNWKNDHNSTTSNSESYSAPYQSTEAMIQARIQQANKNPDLNVRKRKNYRGYHTNNKSKVVRPQLIDTRNIAKLNSEKTNVFSNVKKIESGITIKLVENSDNKKKKIIIKNPRYVYPLTCLRGFEIQCCKINRLYCSILTIHVCIFTKLLKYNNL